MELSHAELLESFASAFTKEGLPAQLLAKGAHAPFDQLFLELPPLPNGSKMRMELLFLAEHDSMTSLQVFIRLPFTFDAESVASLGRIIPLVNEQLPITGFGFNEQNRWVYYRHCHFCNPQNLAFEEVNRLCSLTVYMIRQFGGVIGGVSTGKMSLEEGTAKVQSILNGQKGN